jgi:hypothetical protein
MSATVARIESPALDFPLTYLVADGKSVPPLKGLGFNLFADPALKRWAIIFCPASRDSGISVTAVTQSLNSLSERSKSRSKCNFSRSL